MFSLFLYVLNGFKKNWFMYFYALIFFAYNPRILHITPGPEYAKMHRILCPKQLLTDQICVFFGRVFFPVEGIPSNFKPCTCQSNLLAGPRNILGWNSSEKIAFKEVELYFQTKKLAEKAYIIFRIIWQYFSQKGNWIIENWRKKHFFITVTSEINILWIVRLKMPQSCFFVLYIRVLINDSWVPSQTDL